ncbi:uncharacterized protein LOC114242568 isoform X2 [Bombyx mandarina]|uniref:RRM domain-containing protein n=2 Tax=Bombyx TaxID=7090 RepID=A0A8R1WIY1_BOMMO|nr:uncharacterized protein LOC101738399 isoform X2 [Bombyx mori]XP_028029569.1 uncharacterized protein LOC114242568 isoform X2 [Bombyx mandarina]
MVAQKKGRGAKTQAAKPKPAEDVVEEAEVPEQAEENNGVSDQVEHGDDGIAAEGAENADESTEGDQNQENPDGETKTEEKQEEKVETGKLLVENLPSSYLFDYQEKLKELFSKHGEINTVKRGPIIVTELTTTPTLSAIVEFKNKDSLEKALSEHGAVVEGHALSVAVESRAETAVLVGVPYEASTDYVRLLFAHCGDVAHIHEFSKTKYKILRVTFHDKESVEKALKLDRELRINGFLVTVSKYRDEDEQKAHNNKRQHPQQQNRNAASAANNTSSPAGRANNFRSRGSSFNAQGNFRGTRGRGGGGGFGRGGGFPRGGFAPVTSYMPPQGFLARPGGFINDGQRPNKRLRKY